MNPTLPTLTEIVTQVTDFAAQYGVFLAAGITVSLLGYGLSRILKAGR